MAKRISPDRLAGRMESLFEGQPSLRLPMHKIEAQLHLRKGDRTAFLIALHGLEEEGRLRRDTKGRYYRPEGAKGTPSQVLGILSSLHTTFGFVTLDEGLGDCYISGYDLNGALPGDKVSVTLLPDSRRGKQGKILSVVQEGERRYVGLLYEEHRRLYVTAGNGFRYDLAVQRGSAEGFSPGELVQYTVMPSRSGEWRAVCERSYGRGESARVCADALLDEYGISTAFSEKALAEAAWRSQLPCDLQEEQREDLREWTIFTIDGADAKDLDDAVSLQAMEDGWLLGVHIADVSFYVVPHTPLDSEAYERGTSVYFADRVVPMLPESLSNGACSLNAGEDKRALSALIRLNRQGEILGCRLTKTLIRSCVRGVYSEVNALFEGNATSVIAEKYQPILPILQDMRCLVKEMKQASQKRGVLQLESVECRIHLNENGEADGIVPRPAGEAEELIEQLMITANTAVAKLAKENHLPFVYRVHESPNTERLGQLFDFARVQNLPVPSSAEGVTPHLLQRLVQAAGETPFARLISDRLLRCMAKAKYAPDPLGHYGLALADYCHFTSPIRRYPDLMIHRILGRYLCGEAAERLQKTLKSVTAEAAQQSTTAEIRAMNAERACENCYKAEYMRRYLGDRFTGLIVSVTAAGLFVELENTVCGLVPVEELPEGYLEYDGFLSLADGLGRPVYSVGQQVEIQVAACDVPAGRVKFAFCGFLSTGD
ncbi:MAG: VacB/RNase II family 3'-5' exoribonuclease [Clostridia bacterium]|nr:VacB/RNase II family 3'-5' exoribonuclease [Clostridia bacterium]